MSIYTYETEAGLSVCLLREGGQVVIEHIHTNRGVQLTRLSTSVQSYPNANVCHTTCYTQAVPYSVFMQFSA